MTEADLLAALTALVADGLVLLEIDAVDDAASPRIRPTAKGLAYADDLARDHELADALRGDVS